MQKLENEINIANMKLGQNKRKFYMTIFELSIHLCERTKLLTLFQQLELKNKMMEVTFYS